MAGLRAPNIFGGADFSGYARAAQMIAQTGQIQGQSSANIGANLGAGVGGAIAVKQRKNELRAARLDRATERQADRETRLADRADARAYEAETEKRRHQYRLDEAAAEIGMKQKAALEADQQLLAQAAAQGVPIPPEMQQAALAKKSALDRISAGLEAVVSRLRGGKPSGAPAPMALPRADGSVVVGTSDDLAIPATAQRVAYYEVLAREAKSPAVALRFGSMAAAEKTRLGLLQSGQQSKQKAQEQAAKDAELASTKESLADRIYEAAIVDGIPAEKAGVLVDTWIKSPTASVESIGDDLRAELGQIQAERQRGKSNEFREEGLAVRKQSLELARQKWMARDKKDGGLDADKVADGIDRYASQWGWDDQSLLPGTLSDDEVRAGLASKKLGTFTREKLEGLAQQRGIPLVPDGSMPGDNANVPVPAEAPSIGGAPAREVDPDVAKIEAEEARLGRALTDEETARLLGIR